MGCSCTFQWRFQRFGNTAQEQILPLWLRTLRSPRGISLTSLTVALCLASVDCLLWHTALRLQLFPGCLRFPVSFLTFILCLIAPFEARSKPTPSPRLRMSVPGDVACCSVTLGVLSSVSRLLRQGDGYHSSPLLPAAAFMFVLVSGLKTSSKGVVGNLISRILSSLGSEAFLPCAWPGTQSYRWCQRYLRGVPRSRPLLHKQVLVATLLGWLDTFLRCLKSIQWVDF